jgi:hypothetical protein
MPTLVVGLAGAIMPPISYSPQWIHDFRPSLGAREEHGIDS